MLKLFPAEALPPHVLKAWRAVITPPMALVPVGGIVPESIALTQQQGPAASAWARPCTCPATRPPK